MGHPTRRAVVSGVAAALALPNAVRAAPVRLPATAGLKDHAARAGIVFGSAIAGENFDLAEGRALYEAECGSVTTDLALKFGSLRPTRDAYRFEFADGIVAWARDKGLLMRGHTLIWNEYNPDWLNRCSAKEIARIFDEHIERVVSRYAGRIHTWDVVNEPFWPDHGTPGGYREGPWYNALGPGYIARALNRVRSLDKTAKLCVNEAHLTLDNSWGQGIRPCFARMVADLRHTGAPLDAAGLQCHLDPGQPRNYERFGDYCAGLARQGVALHVTEFDVNDTSFPDAVGRRDQMVAAEASAFLKPVLAVPAVSMVSTWELADRWSFYWHAVHDADPGARRLPRPLPFDDDLQRKPLWTAIAAAFDARAAA